MELLRSGDYSKFIAHQYDGVTIANVRDSWHIVVYDLYKSVLKAHQLTEVYMAIAQ